MNKLVSIIIPTYNRTNYLKLTLDSIENQSFKDYEVLVIDDGTPGDDNLLLCKEYEKVEYTKILNSGGPSKPRNVGIAKAIGKYIAFVDDDDTWLPSKLEKQVKILEENPDFGLVHGCCEVINEDGVLQNIIVGRPGKPDVKHGDVKMRMIGNWTVMMPTSLVRKEVVDKVGCFNESMPSAGEDAEFWVRCSFDTKFYYQDEVLVYYRVHGNNISTENKNFIKLPLYLKKVLKNQLILKKINKRDYLLLLNNLIKTQIKMFNLNYVKNAYYLFNLDKFWVLSFSNIKLMVYIILFRK